MRRFCTLLATTLLSTGFVALPAMPAHAAESTTFTTWTSTAQFSKGIASTAVISAGNLQMKPNTTSGVWESPWVNGSATSVIPSWN